jgi:hypothetical protein
MKGIVTAAMAGLIAVPQFVRFQAPRLSPRHIRTVGLHRLHEKLSRRAKADPASGKVDLEALDFDAPTKQSGVHYLPTPWLVLDWVHAALPIDKTKFTFLDLGAGKGRAVVSAAMQPYAGVAGVEFAPQLAQFAEANVKVLPVTERASGPVTIYCADATTFALPDRPLVIFLFNPFGPPVINAVAANIAASLRDSPRPVWIAYLNPKHADVFDRLPELQRVRLPTATAAKFGVLSPYRLNIYKSAIAGTA